MLQLDTLPETWNDYDLVVTASMLEYVSRPDFSIALGVLRQRLCSGGSLLLFITRNKMRLLIGRRWSAPESLTFSIWPRDSEEAPSEPQVR